LNKIIGNKKGISPLFVSLYLLIIIVLLVSTLFIGVSLSNATIIESMKNEEAQSQEKIALVGPEALNLTADENYVHSLRVNNTGSITVRIRGLYINHQFICDPSELEGDAYIKPKGYLWIRLYPTYQIEFATNINSIWTVTTERGTKAAETGGNLTFGNGGTYIPNKFYFGPLMLIFDMFHWRSENGPWRNGWTIPKGTPDVTWRILLVNVDNRDIEIKETSCLTLISNDNSPKDPLAWYIDPTLSSTILKPGVFNYIYYTWNKPISHSGASRQGITGMSEFTTCINFLTFFGSFIEVNGTTPFGQTVPFEAVLVTTDSMAASVQLTSNPSNIRNDGNSTATITTTVRDESGNPVGDAWIDLSTTAGELSESYIQTDENGVAIVTLTSSTSKTVAHVAAVSQGVYGSCHIGFTPATKIYISAYPSSISKNGGTSDITVQLVDENDQNVAQQGIIITVALSDSDWTGQLNKKPILIYETESGDSVTVATDSSGKATILLRSNGGDGTANIRATASGLSPSSTIVEVT
jgi:hypothetical protein